MRKLLSVFLVSGLVLVLASCNKKEDKSQTTMSPSTLQQAGMSAGMSGMQKIERSVIVPAEVVAAWTAARLVIADKAAKTSQEYIIPTGSDVVISHMKHRIVVKVLVFLPDFKMNDQTITSASNKSSNPAVQLLVQEDGKKEWKGWLFSAHPGIHPFPHERIDIQLLGGVPK